MKRLLCLLLALTLTLSLCACGDDGGSKKNKNDRNDTTPSNTAQRGNQIGDLAYGTTLTAIDQSGYTDHTFDPTSLGKITVINFWAYWCPPCVRELPHFAEVAEEYADEVAIVAVHCDDVARAQEFLTDNYPDSHILFAMDKNNDPFAYYQQLGGTGSIPYTVVLDADGIIRKTFVGAISYDTLMDAIDACR